MVETVERTAALELPLAPKWLMPTAVIVTSPQGARDVLGRTGAHVDKARVHEEMRHLLGRNLFDLNHELWLPRRRALQPVCTNQHVRAFGGHMAQAAEMVAAGSRGGATVDLDAECRRLTLRVWAARCSASISISISTNTPKPSRSRYRSLSKM